MGRVHVVRRVADASVGEAESVWHDPARWPSWVDGFGRVAHVDDAWPSPGSQLSWDSPPGGRGRVLERVQDHAPGRGSRIAVEDERMRGEQTVAFRPLENGVEVVAALDYELKRGGPAARVLDALFVTRQQRDALARTLARFDAELAAERAERERR